jgi:ADP-ribosyl-[dinitrogen reductase] hydrolase
MISITSAFAVAIVGAGRSRGQIGMSCCPGRAGPWTFPTGSERELERDVETVARWGAQAMVTLLDDLELARLRLQSLPGLLASAGIALYRAPLSAQQVPAADFESAWRKIGPRLREILWQGGKVALHCRDGKERTGLVAARLLVELGCHPLDAINRVRAARPGAIDSQAQEEYVRRQRPLSEPYEGVQLALLDEQPEPANGAAWSNPFVWTPATTADNLQGLPSQRVRTQGMSGTEGTKS